MTNNCVNLAFVLISGQNWSWMSSLVIDHSPSTSTRFTIIFCKFMGGMWFLLARNSLGASLLQELWDYYISIQFWTYQSLP